MYSKYSKLGQRHENARKTSSCCLNIRIFRQITYFLTVSDRRFIYIVMFLGFADVCFLFQRNFRGCLMRLSFLMVAMYSAFLSMYTFKYFINRLILSIVFLDIFKSIIFFHSFFFLSFFLSFGFFKKLVS